MTAAHRLRGVGWFGTCVAVVLSLYLVSLQVAAERKKLDDVNRRVATAERDIRALETEFDTRGNLAQLEKWNGDTLALTAPVAGQFVTNEAALASIDVTAASGEAPVRTAALLVPSLAGVSLQAPIVPAAAPAPVAPAAAAPASAPVQMAGVQSASAAATPSDASIVRSAVMRAVASAPKAQAALLRAAAVANVRPQAVAMLDRKLLSDNTLGDLLKSARSEARPR
jgi:hypothetical protein